MKIFIRFLIRAVVASLSFAAFAQNYSIDKFAIAGGGGTSTGAVYSVTGTIGQPDASGPLSGGTYTLVGGFWALPSAVQTPGAPTLLIANLQNGNAKVSWLPNTPGFVSQEAGTLNSVPTTWTNAPAAYTNGATISASVQTRYFRLIKP